jgi:hypothetical protein
MSEKKNNLYCEPWIMFIVGSLVFVELVYSGKVPETRSTQSVHCLLK